ncbi:MAG TPA: EGF domain-containing protein [Polyangiaceae bacterium LLY-WYZ-15_(1-7)]|nr:EGF domain-containing protein [Polyangiaceae bacterium LLY-WYZ-15_(1-7)]HJL13067.1 EGF domain-containing protein [Polyangiaceae bacterium LLY-WYZ-15_(1-7)]HJL45920.1 EGF domain-containing protein [Polyangiaceae bacterium LLY-WYZ-15_(1-7)]
MQRRICSVEWGSRLARWSLGVALALVAACADGGGEPSPDCERTADCPVGSMCLDGVCIAEDAGSPRVDAGGGTDAGAPDAACSDMDMDGICDDFDECINGDDGLDADGDDVADACDICAGGADGDDADGDGVPDFCDCDTSGPTTCDMNASCTESETGVVCACDDGYTGDGASCAPVDCGAPSTPADGSVDVTETTFGSTATYACGAGFTLVGMMERTCEADGTWSGDDPICTSIDCGPLGNPANGSVDAPSTGFSAVATYSCSTGYLLEGDATRTCGGDGLWSGSEPSCRLVDCGSLGSPANGSVSTDRTTLGGTASYGCNTGYEIVGTDTRTCEASGSWSGSAPSCTPVDCGSLPSPTNGSVSFSSTTFGSIASYSCDSGFMMTGGDVARTCQAEGTWSGNAPMCVPEIVDCGSPPSLSGGSVSAPSTTAGSFATYSCSSGRQMAGSDLLYCDADGDWLGALPVCLPPVSCGCGGAYSQGERVTATTDIASGLTTGTAGTVVAGNTGSSLELLVEWDGWTGGHTGNCSVADCATCTEGSVRNRWWVACSSVTTQRLTCGCDGRFSPGDRVMALVDGPSSARDVSRGRLGTIIAGNSGSSLEMLVQWDGWTSGHDGNCSVADCGTCTASATDNRWWTACDQIGNAP